MSQLKRRDILKIGALGAAGAATGLGFPGIIRAQQKEIVILGLWDQTGAFADVGPLNDRGTRMALEERDMKVLGRPIKYVTRDGATQAGTSTRRAEEAIDGEGARFMIGPWSSGVALAVSEVAKRKKVVHLFSGGTEDISGSRCHRYSFQWAASPYTAAKTVVDAFMKANPKAKRWHLLVADYAFGWSVEKYIKEVGKTHGIEFVGADRHPLGEREFSNYAQKAAANRPDVVVMINFGGDAVASAREIFNFGLTPKIPLIMSWSSGVEELVQLTPEIRENTWVGSNFYYTADTPVAKAFVKSYQTKWGNPPGYAPSASYSMTRLLLAGFDKAKSAEVQDVIKALEGIEVNDIVGPMRMDAATHQNIRPYFFMRCKTKSAMKHPTDFADIIATGDAPLPKEYAACKDIGSF
jgi:branched-chain amino acid transport system substrate-binding protein